MKTRLDLCDWIVEALKELNGSYWAATQLRAKGILKNAKATSKNVWALSK